MLGVLGMIELVSNLTELALHASFLVLDFEVGIVEDPVLVDFG